MKCPYDIFKDYLPNKHSGKYPLNPILYIYDGDNICSAYSFDKFKLVLYISDYNQTKYRYMSLYEFNDREYIILDNKILKDLLLELECNKELPF